MVRYSLLLLLLPLLSSADDLDSLRAAGLARWQRERVTDYGDESLYSGFVEKHAVVRSVCDPVKDSEERWMCFKRGLRLAHRMRGYRNISRVASDAVATQHSSAGNTGARVFVVNGVVHSWELLRGLPDQDERYLTLLLSRLVEAVNGGALRPGLTFDLIVHFTDRGYCLPSTEAPVYPVARHTIPDSECPYASPVPIIEPVQRFGTAPRDDELKPFAQLEPVAYYRGTYWNNHRLYLSILSEAEMVERLDVGLVGVPWYYKPLSYQSHNNVHDCRAFFHEAEGSGLLDNATTEAIGGAAACELTKANASNNGHSLWKQALPIRQWHRYRYPLAIDGVGAVLRIVALLQGSGVVLGLQLDYKEYWFPDIVPFVHYVPITADMHSLRQNLTDTLQWLESNPDIAQNISQAGRRFVLKHKTTLSDFRQWKTYFELLAAAWVGPSSPPHPQHCPPLHCSANPHSVNGGRDNLTFMIRRSWEAACGHDPEALRDGLMHEMPPVSPQYEPTVHSRECWAQALPSWQEPSKAWWPSGLAACLAGVVLWFFLRRHVSLLRFWG